MLKIQWTVNLLSRWVKAPFKRKKLFLFFLWFHLTCWWMLILWVDIHIACEQQTHFRSSLLSLRKIASAISSSKTISVTSVFLHQSEFGSYFCGANTRGLYVALRGDLDIREKTIMAEDGESSLDHAFVKVCDIFGFEKLKRPCA